MESGSGIFVHKSRSGAPDFRRKIRMQSTRDVTLIAFHCTCTSVITDIVPVMAVSNEELDSIIIQAAQKLGYPYRSNLVAFVVDEVHCVTKWLVSSYNVSAGFISC